MVTEVGIDSIFKSIQQKSVEDFTRDEYRVAKCYSPVVWTQSEISLLWKLDEASPLPFCWHLVFVPRRYQCPLLVPRPGHHLVLLLCQKNVKTVEWKKFIYCPLCRLGVAVTKIVLIFSVTNFHIVGLLFLTAAFLTQTICLDDVVVKFEIWDTAGQERYHSLAPMYYRGAQAAIVMYDITNKVNGRHLPAFY